MRTMVYTIEESPKKEGKTVLTVDPYHGKRVNRTHPQTIRELASTCEELVCHFPVEPFHYREVKRHATQNAMEACVEQNVPMIMETMKEVPEWALESLTRHKYSELKLCLNTFDKKKWKLQEPMSDDPSLLRTSFINSFNNGVFTVLSIAPVVPGLVTMHDIFEVVDVVKYWAKGVEISPKSFSISEFSEFRSLIVSKKLPEIDEYYFLNGTKYEIDPTYWLKLLSKLELFLTGTKLSLKVTEG